MHVVGAGRCEKQSLGFRAPARIIPLKKQVTNGLGAPTPSGLTRDEAARFRGPQEPKRVP